MAQYIDKEVLVAEIDRQEIGYNTDGKHSVEYDTTRKILNIIDTLEVKEVDLDAMGVLAEHLIACDAHLVTPKYTDKELDLLEEWAKK